jgi:hypothetical protein
MNFGNVTVGATARMTETLTNTGSAPLTFGTFYYTNSKTSTANDHCSGATVASGGSCTLDVVVAPNTVGAGSGMVQFTYSNPSLGVATDEWTVTWAGVAPTTTAPTTVTTSLLAGSLSGPTISLKLGSDVPQVQDTATLTGANARTASGTVTYIAYSDSACTVAVPDATEAVTVANGVVPASKGFDLTPGTYYWRAVYSGDSLNQPSSSPCGSETEVVAGEAPVAPGCWGPSSPPMTIRRDALDGQLRIAPGSVFPGGSFNAVVSCRATNVLKHASHLRVEFVERHDRSVAYSGIVSYPDKRNLADLEVTLPLGAHKGSLTCGTQAPATQARLPKIPPGAFQLSFAAYLAYYAKCVPLSHGAPIQVIRKPAANHPTCSGTAPATFLTLPNHSSSPGKTSLLLWCQLRSATINGFTGYWAPARVVLYDYASFQNLTLVNGTLVNRSAFPVRPPIQVAFTVVGPQDIDITVPAALPSAVYVPVLITNGGVTIPSSNLLNVP